jgi:hypothetical protein
VLGGFTVTQDVKFHDQVFWANLSG